MFNLQRFKRFGRVEISGEKIFLFCFSVTLIASFLANTTFTQYIVIKDFNRINYLMMFVLALKIYILDDFNWKQLFAVSGLLLLGIYSWRVTKINSVMILLTYILAAKNVNFNRIVRRYFKVNFILIALTSLYSVMGIIRNLSYSRGGVERYAMGIIYPTDYASYIFYLILAFCFLHYKKLGKFHYLSFIFIAVVLYLITNARLDFVLILLIVPVVMIAKKGESENFGLSKILASNYWSSIIILPYCYILLNIYFKPSVSIYHYLDKLLSGRLTYGSIAMHRYSIHLFGQKIVEHGWGGIKGSEMLKNNPAKYFFIDSSFVRLLMIYGAVLFVLLIAVMMIISLRGELRENYLMPAILLMITLSSLIDQHLLELSFNPFLLALLANKVYQSSIKQSLIRE